MKPMSPFTLHDNNQNSHWDMQFYYIFFIFVLNKSRGMADFASRNHIFGETLQYYNCI